MSGLFASAEYDEEADAVWEAIDYMMDSRRKDRREARLKEEIEKYCKSNPNPNPNITEQFAELKRKLHTMSTDELDCIPKIGDYSVSGQTVADLDPKGYLPDRDAEISDIKKARLLLKYVTQTNPRNGPGWVAAARLEEVAGKLKMARQLIETGCEECPESEDVWVEACRLASHNEAKAVIARGVKAIPNSVKLWLEAAKLEHDESNNKH